MRFQDVRQMIDDAIKPIRNRVLNALARGVLSNVDDDDGMQVVQVDLLDSETRDELDRFQNYGFTSKPRKDAEALVMFVGGKRDNGIVFAVEDRRYRITSLEDGEVCVYNDTGAKMLFKANGDVEITPKSGQKLKLNCDVECTGDVVASGISLKNHTHGPGSFSTTVGSGGGGGPVSGSSGAPS